MRYTALLSMLAAVAAQDPPFCDSFPAATPLETVAPGGASQTVETPAAGDGTILSSASGYEPVWLATAFLAALL